MVARPSVNDKHSLASRFRRKRFALISSLLVPLLKEKERVTVLDIGGRRDYWYLMEPEIAQRLSIVILNNEKSELSVGQMQGDVLDISYELGDARNMPQYADRSFDLAHANSVIEHVGGLLDMAHMADETRRVGNAYYVQTPYLWFPIEPHYGVPFFHWLPAPTRAAWEARRKIGYRAQPKSYRDALATADHTSLVNATLMRELFPDGELIRERFAFLTKSLIAMRRHRPK